MGAGPFLSSDFDIKKIPILPVITHAGEGQLLKYFSQMVANCLIGSSRANTLVSKFLC
jgi:hypothetical protein